MSRKLAIVWLIAGILGEPPAFFGAPKSLTDFVG
jgi:hypothetical protein